MTGSGLTHDHGVCAGVPFGRLGYCRACGQFKHVFVADNPAGDMFQVCSACLAGAYGSVDVAVWNDALDRNFRPLVGDHRLLNGETA